MLLFCGVLLFLPQFVGRGLPLDKSSGMGIIINRRGRCDKRSAPSSKDLHQGFTPKKKPSLGRVAVSSFQLLNSDRD